MNALLLAPLPVFLLATLKLPAQSAQSAQATWVQGLVTGTGSKPLSGSTVRLLSLDGELLGAVITDTAGTFRVFVPNGTSSAILTARMLGYASSVDTLLASRGDFARSHHISLNEVSTSIEGLRIVASRPAPDRTVAGAGELNLLDQSSLVLNDPTGDLLRSLAQIPGLNLTDLGNGKLGLSAFGMGSDQNSFTLNGSESGVRMPRNGLRHSVRMSSYDPRTGRFGGVQISSVFPSGTPIKLRTAQISVSPSSFTTSYNGQLPVASAPIVLSGTMSGPLDASETTMPKRYYSVAADFLRTLEPTDMFGSLLSSTPSDSTLRLVRSRASFLGIPTESARSLPRSSEQASAVARIDLTSYATGINGRDGPVLYMLAAGSLEHSAALGLLPWATSSKASRSIATDGQLTLVYAPYFRSILSETKASLSAGRSETEPLTKFPSASIMVPEDLSDGTLVETGGSGSYSTRNSRSLQVTSDWQWMSFSGNHRFNAFADFLSRGVRSSSAANTLGTWEYASIDAFNQNTPSRFTIEPFARTRVATLNQLALAFSDVLIVGSPIPQDGESGGLTLQAGIRLDYDWFARAGGAGTRFEMPRRLEVQPMLGATWRKGGWSSSSQGARLSDTKYTTTIGIRRYSGAPSPSDVSLLVDPNDQSSFRTECVGTAAPRPEWSLIAAGALAPRVCNSGAQSSALSAVPGSRTYSRNFRWPESWRGELQFRNAISPTLEFRLGSTIALNNRNMSSIDLNLQSQPIFRTSIDDRAVYVSMSQIDSSSGLIPFQASRVDSTHGRRVTLVSDSRSRSVLFTVGGTWKSAPFLTTGDIREPAWKTSIDAWYSWQRNTASQRGFNGTTSGDPRVMEHGIPINAPHSAQLTISVARRDWISASLGIRLSAGEPFTPIVGGDVNGDGLTNDRAFVPTSGAIGEQMESLLPSLDAGIRRCLERQRGRIVAAASCRKGISVNTGTIAVSLDPYRLGFGRRGTIRVSIHNALSGIDKVLHGTRTRGWGTTDYVDPVLLIPRGFSNRTGDFDYVVNQSFGSRGAHGRLMQKPVMIMVDASFRLERDFEQQYLKMQATIMEDERLRTDSATFDWLWTTARRSQLWSWTGDPALLDSLRLDAKVRASIDSIIMNTTELRMKRYKELASFLTPKRARDINGGVRNRWHKTIVDVATFTLKANQKIVRLLTDAERERAVALGLGTAWSLDDAWLSRLRRSWLIQPW